ncbi:hypothetical protein ACFLXH_02980, partial [Chloroflexota bacterium]
MRKWWGSKSAAWGEAFVLQALGYFLTQLNPLFGGIVWGLLFLLGALLIWRSHKSNDADNDHDYVDKIIVGSKVPAVLEITNTLQKMADRQNVILSNLMTRTIRQKKLIKIQQYLQRKLSLRPGDPKLGDAIKIELLSIQIKKLNLSSEEFNEEHIKVFTAITWALDEFDCGLPQKLDGDEEYELINSQLSSQSKNVSGRDAKELLLMYSDVALGWNSAILYISYIPESHRANMPPQVNKSIRQMKYERDQVLKTFL